MRKTIFVSLILLLVAGCVERAPKVMGRYTVWLGSAAVAVGYQTDEYTKDNDMLSFTDKREGKLITSPLCSVWKIEGN